MKTIFRFLALAMLLATFSAATVTTGFAQDAAADKAALYKTYIDNYDKPEIAKREAALDAAKKYVEKYGANAEDKEQVDYFKAAIPDLEKGIAASNKAAADAEEQKKMQGLYEAFNKAATAKDVPGIFTHGKAILAKQPEFLDVIIVLANAGFDQTLADPKSAVYTDDVINYARTAISKIEAGKESESKNYGALSYSLGNKNNALRILNYSIGYITSVRQDKKKEALPYFYKAAKLETGNKGIPLIYQAMGAYYLDEALKINTDREAKIKAAGGTDTPESLEMEANQRGYADRAIDAYARAYKLAKDDKTAKKEYVDGLYSKLTDLYKFRYEGKTEGINEYVASVQSKPLPDPSTPITPVKVDVPAPANTTGTTNTNTTAPAATPKPATTPVTNPSGAVSKPATDDAASGGDRANAKKATPKKKGTR